MVNPGLAERNGSDVGGFALRELLGVVLVVGLITAWALHHTLTRDPGHLLEEEMTRLHNLLILAERETEAVDQPMGVIFHPRGYRFLAWNGVTWQDATDDGPWQRRQLPEPLTLRLWLQEGEAEELSKPPAAPHLVINPGHEHTPFQLEARGGPEAAMRLVGDPMGVMLLNEPGESREESR